MLIDWGLIMLFHFFIGVSNYPLKADESAMGAINRPLLIVSYWANGLEGADTALGRALTG